MKSWLQLVLPTFWRLGFGAVASVAIYRLACRCGIYRYWMPMQQWKGGGDFFAPTSAKPPPLSLPSRETLLGRAERLLEGEVDYFSNIHKKIGNPPDWFRDPFNGSLLDKERERHWSTLDEFSTGDIKNVWEASRFEWVPLFAKAWRLTGDDRYLKTLNAWLLDWVLRNPANAGPNWKCGQEASIRLINLLLAARLLDTQGKPSTSLVKLVALHCARIMPTIRYAIAQNNNHGTSEAAALFIGGSWLLARSVSVPLKKDSHRWRDAGRRWFEDRVNALVAVDGSFSQYSVNYHRVFIDTLCQVELWRAELKEHPFTETFVARCRAAVEWLAAMIDAGSGTAPNLGADDGARLYDLSSASYRDYRPSVQLASLLFCGRRTYESGAWDEPLLWLGRESSADLIPSRGAGVIHRNGGELILRGDHSWGLIRFARFRFRPSHADCLHLDLWYRGQNILRDGGTFSYNTDLCWLDYFSGTESHNTVQFDDRNQMPRIGRFLFGGWLKMDECTGIQRQYNSLCWVGAYTDWKQARHRRTISVKGNIWRIIDEISGYQYKAVLRWRLIPAQWKLVSNTCTSSFAALHITSAAPVRRLELNAGWESLYYQQKTELPVLEMEVGPGSWTIETDIFLKD